ncbi:MAG: tetratricopeptide repeat protein [Alphaproteobacteria bacterium]|nr:tetratricopeptide repeat protein [Alphaproteobacteria bacterium]
MRAGFAHHQAGRLRHAEALYRKALHKNPGDANALHLLGVLAYQRGAAGQALRLIERALPTLPDIPDVHLNFGNVLRELGRLEEAVTSYRRALALKPDYGMAHNNLAAVLNQQGEFRAGLAGSERAIVLIPEFFGTHVTHADALMGLERFAEAEAPLRRALDLAPDRAQTHRDLGWVLAKLGRHKEAMASLEHAIALDPGDPAVYFALAATLFLAKDLAGSEAGFRRALALAPAYAAAWHELGTLLRSTGRFDEALVCFNRAIELDPDRPEIYRSLAATGQQASDEAELQRLQTILKDQKRSVSDRVSGGFALGMLLDNAGRCDEAFPAFAEANTLYRRERAVAGDRFDIEAFRRQVDDLIELATPAFFSMAASWGTASQLPVFIVGMPRSGTTLVEQIAASHSRVVGAGELNAIGEIWDHLAAHNRGLPLEKWDAAHARQLARRHLAFLQGLGNGALRVVDKMPDNIFFLWLIAALFPAARIIWCRRDLRDTCLSCFFHHFTDGNIYAYDLADCATRAAEVERLGGHWLRVLPLQILVIDYEKLVANPEHETHRLTDFLDLAWEPACLDFHRTERPVLTASAWQVRQPLYTCSVGRWRRYADHLARHWREGSSKEKAAPRGRRL